MAKHHCSPCYPMRTTWKLWTSMPQEKEVPCFLIHTRYTDHTSVVKCRKHPMVNYASWSFSNMPHPLSSLWSLSSLESLYSWHSPYSIIIMIHSLTPFSLSAGLDWLLAHHQTIAPHGANAQGPGYAKNAADATGNSWHGIHQYIFTLWMYTVHMSHVCVYIYNYIYRES